MTLPPKEQIKSQVESSESILIITKPNATADAAAASWGLNELFRSLGKKPVLLKNEFLSGRLDFLPKPENMEEKIVGARDFVLSFDTKRNKIIDFRAERKESTFEIFVTPEKETIDPRDFSFIPAKFKYDLLFVIGCQNLEELGELRERNSDLFFEVPIVNIDNSAENEKFGQMNLVDITSASLSEIASELAKDFGEKHVSPTCAEYFLAGIVSATSNFQNSHTSPQTLLRASWLIEKGADQQKIVRHLMKTQSFPFMKLWGRVMARLNWDEKLKFAWSLVSLEDFVKSRTTHEDLPLILEKVKDNFSSGKIFAVIFSEELKKNTALVQCVDLDFCARLQRELGGEMRGDYFSVVFEGKDILEAEKELLEKLQEEARGA